MEIERIKAAILSGKVRITDHADEEGANDTIEYDEIYSSVMHGEVIEDYPNDKPYPSCLILGRDLIGRPIHSVWAYIKKNGWTVLITVYCPDPKRWVNWKERIRR